MRTGPVARISSIKHTFLRGRDGSLDRGRNLDDMARCTKGTASRRFKFALQYGACFVVIGYLYFAVVKRHGGELSENDVVGTEQESRNYLMQKATNVVDDALGLAITEKRKKAQAAPSYDAAVRNDYGAQDDQKAAHGSIESESVHSACGGSWKTDWSAIEQGKPRILLDEERFIYPILVNGPNNQLIGLRDTIYLAIRLNRTIIIPHFYKHKTDSSAEKGSLAYIPASQRVDVASIAALVSVVPYRDLQDTCSEGFDDLFFTSYEASYASLHRAIEDLGVPVREDASRYPKDMEPSFGPRSIKSDKESLLALYDSPGRCALYAFPFRTVGTKQNSQSLRKTYGEFFEDDVLKIKNINADSLSDRDLYSLIVHSTPTAKHVASMVDDFLDVHELREAPYLSVHWRYDPVDWQTRCRKQDRLVRKGKQFMIEMCRKIEAIEPVDVAKAVFNQVRKVQRQASIQLEALYFAAPLNMEEFVSEMKSALIRRFEKEGVLETFRVLTHANLHGHLQKFSSCEGLKENYEDIFSQLEMDICSRSTVFLRSPTSSWSQVVNDVRLTISMGKYDDNIFDLTWQVASRRLGGS